MTPTPQPAALLSAQQQKLHEMTGYYCVICGKFLPADEHEVIVHDDVPHPVDMDFGDEEKPQ